jgi:hypothetical protein
MNLHGIVAPIIAGVNPMVVARVQVSTGYTTGADGGRVPTYGPVISVTAQVQPLTSRDLQQIEGLNIQGTLKAIYLCGDLKGAVRSELKGGDLVTLPDGTVWLVVQMLESWGLTAGWSKSAMVLQNGG